MDHHSIARDWIDAWNAHDLDRIIAHYRHDVTFRSPFAVALSGDASGTIHGTAALRAYFAAALERAPDLHFELEDVLVGAGSIAVRYRSVLDLPAIEVMAIDGDGLAYDVRCHYGAAGSNR